LGQVSSVKVFTGPPPPLAPVRIRAESADMFLLLPSTLLANFVLIITILLA
jgi:hypothetical protein